MRIAYFQKRSKKQSSYSLGTDESFKATESTEYPLSWWTSRIDRLGWIKKTAFSQKSHQSAYLEQLLQMIFVRRFAQFGQHQKFNGDPASIKKESNFKHFFLDQSSGKNFHVKK